MKIDKLHIRSRFKNLENVVVDFDGNNLMTVIVGRNGSGKSNVLEALVAIFRNLDLGESPPFSYMIKYKLGERDTECRIEIDADPERGSLSKQYQVTVKSASIGKENSPEFVPFSKVKRDIKNGEAPYLPNFLFAYYSGPSDRLESLFRKHRDIFYNRLLYKKIGLGAEIRPLFYAKPAHSQFVLLAFFLSNDTENERTFLKQHLGIIGLDSVHFVIRKPQWAKADKNGDIFWGADGVVREFLELLYPNVIAPIKVVRNEETSLTGKNIKNEFLHLFLPDLASLHKFAGNLQPDIFFKMLESTLLSELISEVNIRVNVLSSDKPLTFSELSEGEQQLLTVLGLLKFTGGKDSLFLLDEPDTHLNPAWAVKYLKFLRDFVPNHETSHLLMVTHHPLAIAELEKGQLQVMKRQEVGGVVASMPEESPRGMGINLILRSEMFDLKTTLDTITDDKLTRRNILASQEILTDTEEGELREINDELDKLGFNFISDDPDYMDFLLKKYHSRSVEKF